LPGILLSSNDARSIDRITANGTAIAENIIVFLDAVTNDELPSMFLKLANHTKLRRSGLSINE
jgi:hypothetical protein